VVGKLTQGAVDAGFVYASDVLASGNALVPIELPRTLQPTVVYAVAVVKGTKHETEARRFVAALEGPRGQALLREAGFGPPPR
jgi:molybdate transport system substrate-binding protein